MSEPMPRVAGLPADPPIGAAAGLTDALAERLAPRVRRLGYLGGFFAVGARQPSALAGFVDFTEALKESVPADLTELVALRVAHLLRNSYESAQHVALAGKLGYTPTWIEAVTAGDADSALLTPAQRAALRLAGVLVAHAGHRARAELRALVDECGEDLAVGVVLLVARYVAHAHAANAFELVNPLEAVDAG
jgi:alkylhydroperoxidase family enzyme